MNEKIDLSRYEGHTEGPWYMRNHYNSEAPAVAAGKYDNLLAICGQGPKLTPEGRQWHSHLGIGKPPEEAKANAQLIADAPLLLAEVKRLSALADALWDLLPSYLSTEATDVWNEYNGEEEE